MQAPGCDRPHPFLLRFCHQVLILPALSSLQGTGWDTGGPAGNCSFLLLAINIPVLVSCNLSVPHWCLRHSPHLLDRHHGTLTQSLSQAQSHQATAQGHTANRWPSVPQGAFPAYSAGHRLQVDRV